MSIQSVFITPRRLKRRSQAFTVLICLVFQSVFVPAALAQSPADGVNQTQAQASTQSPSEDEVAEAARRLEQETKGAYPYVPLRRAKEAKSYLFDRTNQWILAGGLAAVALARTQDEEMQEYFDHKNRLGNLDELGNHVLGTGVPGVLLGASFWLLGDLFNRPYTVHAGQAQLETLLVTGIMTNLLKFSFNRERPDQSDRFSFPSGHTSTIFATAAVLNEFYGWKAGVPAFALGALTAASRMSDNRHWFSDTVGGATLAIFIAHAVSRSHLERYRSFEDGKSNVKISLYPMIQQGGGGLVFRATF